MKESRGTQHFIRFRLIDTPISTLESAALLPAKATVVQDRHYKAEN
jgi:hypothetical protein